MIQYQTQREEQYDMIQRWIHVIQQGYIHHDWLLRDMKFVTTTTTTNAPDATPKPKRNRIQTNLSKVNLQKQQEINAIQLQIHQYIDKVLQYNYNISTDPDNHHHASSDVHTPSLMTAPGCGNSSSSTDNNINIDFEWSDDEDDNS
jgi:hypothetical protein